MKSVLSPSYKDVILPVIFIYIEGLNLIVVLSVGRDTFVTRIWSLTRDFTTKRSHLLVLIALKDFAKEVIFLRFLNNLFFTQTLLVLQVILIVISARFTCNSSQSFALIVTRSLRRKKHSYDTSIPLTEINCWTINRQSMKCLPNFHFVGHDKPF